MGNVINYPIGKDEFVKLYVGDSAIEYLFVMEYYSLEVAKEEGRL